MKASFLNKQFYISHEPLAYKILLSLCLILFSLMAWSNFISHSEFWAIASAKLLGSNSDVATVVYYKSFFYLLLKPLHLLPLDNQTHILMARLCFGVIAWLNFGLVFKNIQWLTQSKKPAYLFALFLLTFQIYFYNHFRVRADILTQLLALTMYTTINYQFLRKKNFSIYDSTSTALALFIFLTSPKSLYLLCSLMVYRSFLFYNTVSPLNNVKSFLFIIGLPLSGLFLTSYYLFEVGLLVENPYALALNYHINSSTKLFDYDQWIHVVISIKHNLFHYVALALGILIFFKNKLFRNPLYLAQVLLSTTILLSFLIHTEKWPYFFASLTPWIFLPVIFLFINTKISAKNVFITLAVLLIYPLSVGKPQNWFHSNKKQIELIQKLEKLIHSVPGSSYFDSTGLLPRENIKMWFLGPNDPDSKSYTLRSFRQEKPDFIFLTPKVRLAFPEIMTVLSENYHHVNDSIYLFDGSRHLVNESALKENFQLELIFNYDYLPKTRF